MCVLKKKRIRDHYRVELLPGILAARCLVYGTKEVTRYISGEDAFQVCS